MPVRRRPMSWGDGIVDVEDLVVVAEHLFGQIVDKEGRILFVTDEMTSRSSKRNRKIGSVPVKPLLNPSLLNLYEKTISRYEIRFKVGTTR